MTKIEKGGLNVLTLILGNVLFWLCNVYPRHILEISSARSIVATFINFIYFVLFDLFLVIVFSKNKAPFAKNIFDKNVPVVKRFEIIRLLLLLFIQMIADIIALLIGKMAMEWKYIILDIVIVLQWFVIYIIIADKPIVFWKRPILLLICLVSVTALLGFSIYVDEKWLADTALFFTKYEVGSPILLSIQTNLQFAWEVKALVLDTLIGLIMIWLHLCNMKKEEPEENSDILRGRRVATLLIRGSVLINVFVVMVIFKFTVWPDNSLQRSNTHSRSVGFKERDFYNRVTDYELIRMGEDDTENIYYETHSYYIFWEQCTKQLFFTSDAHWPYDYFSENGQIRNGYTRERFLIGEKEAYLLFNQVICFYEESKPQAIRLEELNYLDKNDIVIAVCKELLAEGNIFIFEYACDYLLINDQAFIRPYIERYAEGRFTDIEKEWMEKNFYKSEYVVNTAKAFS